MELPLHSEGFHTVARQALLYGGPVDARGNAHRADRRRGVGYRRLDRPLPGGGAGFVLVGRTPPRYYLSNASFGPQPNFAQLLVKCSSSAEARALQEFLQDSVRRRFPEPLVKVNRFELNTQPEALIEARFLGPDPAVLDSLVGEAVAVMRRNPKVADARNEWGNMAMMIRPDYDAVRAGAMGITRPG